MTNKEVKQDMLWNARYIGDPNARTMDNEHWPVIYLRLFKIELKYYTLIGNNHYGLTQNIANLKT